MKLSKIVRRVDQIRELTAEVPVDNEKCAALEFELWGDVLHEDSMGKGSPAKSAAALETLKLPFKRRYS